MDAPPPRRRRAAPNPDLFREQATITVMIATAFALVVFKSVLAAVIAGGAQICVAMLLDDVEPEP